MDRSSIPTRAAEDGPAVQPPRSARQWLQTGRTVLQDMRRLHHIPVHLHTIAVGWTDLAGLSAYRFHGASPEVAARHAVLRPTPHIVTPRQNAQFLDHAEEQVINAFLDASYRRRVRIVRQEAGLWIFVSKEVCSACRQGNDNGDVLPGSLMQLSRRFEDLHIRVGWEDPPGGLKVLSFLAGQRDLISRTVV